MRKVLKNHAEVCHVWAQQTQEIGRGGNIFFVDSKIYSYGYHYLMAEIHERKGKRFALVNSFVYSSSTSQHLGYTRSALDGLMPYFSVPNPSDISSAVNALDREVTRALEEALKRKFFADCWWRDKDEKKSILERIDELYAEANHFREIVGRGKMKFPAKLYREAVEHLTKLEERYNSPERVARRAEKECLRAEKRAAMEAQWEKQRLEQEKKSAKALEDFRAGRMFDHFAIDTEFDLLRVRGSRVETSRGAIVPLETAVRLLDIVERRGNIQGFRIGDYTVQGLSEDENAVRIGCHCIQIGEAQSVLRGAEVVALPGT